MREATRQLHELIDDYFKELGETVPGPREASVG